MTNLEIIKHFTSGMTRHENTSSRKALSVRGEKLYSYNLLIAEYVIEEGFCGFVIHDHWGKGLGTVSSTTSQHVGLLLRETKYFPRRLKSEEGQLFK